MGTTKTDTQTDQFDPTGMGAYKGIAGAMGSTLPGFIQNPFGSPQFGLERQMGTRQAQNLGQTGTSDLLRNMTASNMFGGASSPAGVEMLQNQGRANTNLQANLGFLAPYMAALQRQQYAMGLGSQFRPLQTGQTNVQKTSGVGTWAPQIAGFAMGGLPGFMKAFQNQQAPQGVDPNTGSFGMGGPGQGMGMAGTGGDQGGPGEGLMPWFL